MRDAETPVQSVVLRMLYCHLFHLSSAERLTGKKSICAYPYTLANAWWDNNLCLLFKSSHYLTFHSYDNLSPRGKVEPYSSSCFATIYVCHFVLYYATYFLRFCFSFITNIHFYLKNGTYFCNTPSIYHHKIQTSQSASDHELFLFFSILFLSCHCGTS